MMDAELKSMLRQVADGKLTVEAAYAALTADDLGFSRVDTGREARCGWPEVVFGAGKSAEQIAAILRRLQESSGKSVFATRVDAAKAAAVLRLLPEAAYAEAAQIVYIRRPVRPGGCVVVLAAGTSDLPVAEEAAFTAELMGARVERLWDVGVAGLHRLLAHTELLQRANVVIAVAGMEGALASVAGGLTAAPVLAVPTSVGYGASYAGLSALLAMLNSCAAGVAVVNIDNGFGAGYLAAVINRKMLPPADAAADTAAADTAAAE